MELDFGAFMSAIVPLELGFGKPPSDSGQIAFTNTEHPNQFLASAISTSAFRPGKLRAKIMSDWEKPETWTKILDTAAAKLKETFSKSGIEQDKATLSEIIHKNLESLKEVAQHAAAGVKAQAAQWTSHELQIDKIMKTLEALDARLKRLEKSPAARKSKEPSTKRKAPKRKK